MDWVDVEFSLWWRERKGEGKTEFFFLFNFLGKICKKATTMNLQNDNLGDIRYKVVLLVFAVVVAFAAYQRPKVIPSKLVYQTTTHQQYMESGNCVTTYNHWKTQYHNYKNDTKMIYTFPEFGMWEKHILYCPLSGVCIVMYNVTVYWPTSGLFAFNNHFMYKLTDQYVEVKTGGVTPMGKFPGKCMVTYHLIGEKVEKQWEIDEGTIGEVLCPTLLYFQEVCYRKHKANK